MICSKTEWAFIAGFLVGDGCLHSQGNPPYAVVNFSQKDPKVLEWIQERVGGRLIQHKRGHWLLIVATRQGVIDLCEGVYPYMVVKVDQVKLVYALAKLVGGPNNTRRYELHHRLRRLKRG